MTQPQQLRQYPRSRSATRAPRSASISSDRTSSATKSHQALMSAHPSPLILRATSMDREIYPSRKRSSSVQRYRPSSYVPQHQQTQQLSSVTGMANIQRSSSATENGSVISAPSVFSHYNREFREPMSSKHVAKKMTREQSPANSRKSPTEKSQRTTRATRKLIEELHKASESHGLERRIVSITNVCAEFDHADERRHNIELQNGAAQVLAKVLTMANDDDEIRMVCAAIEMVFRAQPAYVHVAFDKCGTIIVPILLRLLERAESGNMKHADVSILNITKTILYISRVNELRYSLARHQGMMDAMRRVATSILNPECRVARVRVVANLVNCEDNKALILHYEGMLDSLLRIAHLDLSDSAREYAGMALMDLASAPCNQISMVQNEKLLGTLVKMVLVEKEAGTREAAITALQNLAFSKENRPKLVVFKEGIVLEALKKALSGDRNDKARRRAAGALTNLACETTSKAMGCYNGLLDTLAIVSTRDENKEVQKRAAMALTKLATSITVHMPCYETLLDALVVASLSSAVNSVSAVLRVKARYPENRARMVAHFGIVDTLADICVDPKSMMKDKENAMRAIMHLTNEDKNRRAMCNERILDALVKGANLSESGTEGIRESAVRAIERLATEHANRPYMARHEGLLVAVAAATAREAKLEAAGAPAQTPFLAKPLLMSLLVAM